VTTEHIHLMGIGGTGMTALAGLLHQAGCRVTGSDRRLYPPTSLILAEMELVVTEGFAAANLQPAPDLVVVGNAISRGNPELEDLLDRGLPYTSMSALISERFLSDRHSIVVAGTHGKTTTTSMVAWLLAHAGRDPGYLIGGKPLNFDRPFQTGQGREFVIEGDEYDTAFFDKGPKFMHYQPDTVLLGAIEFDHADIYRDIEEVERVFGRLVNLIPGRGLLVNNEECRRTVDVGSGAFCRVQGYGLTTGDWRACDLRYQDGLTHFRLLRREHLFADLTMPAGGEYNVLNAISAAAAVHDLGVSAQEIASGLASFKGVSRRLEWRGEVDGVLVLDDFAHHPTAIHATLRGVRKRFPERRIRAILEPRSWSLRRKIFQERLVEVFDAADEVVIAAVFNAQDLPDDQRLDTDRLVSELQQRGQPARFIADADSIASEMTASAAPGDLIVVMSNGGFDGLPGKLVQSLEQRATHDGPVVGS
jgi:UDP-N-acetylmuramate: L-alanyl-gamma-D-glutamyl-meso-diaminopimelate ligase